MDSKNLSVVQNGNSPVARLKQALNADSVQQQFKNALKENAPLFVASLIDVYASDKFLQNCKPSDVIMEALKAATLKLPINKALGFYYIVPFKDNKSQTYIPTGIIGYKGFLQLAQRTAQYRYINADAVYEGEQVEVDRLTGEVFFTGKQKSENAIGYFAHIETINGFRKTIFWTKEQIQSHAQKYSKSYHSKFSPWVNQFDAMAIKTVLRHLLTKYGVMSVDMISAIDIEQHDYDESPVSPKPVRSKNMASYQITETPPAPPQQQETQEPIEQPQPQAEQPQEPAQAIKKDDFGMPMDSPLEKSKWFHMRAGSIKDKTGFAYFVEQNAEHMHSATLQALDAMHAKYMKLYGEPLPVESGGQEQQPSEKPGQDQVDILQSEPAKKLAELAQKHPVEYSAVVKNRMPGSIDQILDWMSRINQMVVDNVTGSTQEPQEIEQAETENNEKAEW